jgi:hypothetical protein
MTSKVTDTEILNLRLKHFFKRVSTLEIRWAKSPFGDSISRAVYKDEFLDQSEDGFTRGELKKCLSRGLVLERTFTNDRGAQRAVIVYKDELLSQVIPLKKKIERLKRVPWTRWIRIAALFLLCLSILMLVIRRRAWGFSGAPAPANIRAERTPGHRVGFFDDAETQVRCYWVEAQTDNITLSCVKIR